MKYEIIFKSGKIKNVVSKDVNKVKNYITESFDDIKSVKRLDESWSPITEDLLRGLCHDLDKKVYYKQFDVKYNDDGNYYIAYVANSGYTVNDCIKAFKKVLENWADKQKPLSSLNVKVYFGARDADDSSSRRAWDIDKCIEKPDMYNVAFQIGNDDGINYITYYNVQSAPVEEVEDMYSIEYTDELGVKCYVIKEDGEYDITDNALRDWDAIYKTSDRKEAERELRRIIKEQGIDAADVRVVETPAHN